jgi:hypothetical protein
MASYNGPFSEVGGESRFRLEDFPEEEEMAAEGIPIGRRFARE